METYRRNSSNLCRIINFLVLFRMRDVHAKLILYSILYSLFGIINGNFYMLDLFDTNYYGVFQKRNYGEFNLTCVYCVKYNEVYLI